MGRADVKKYVRRMKTNTIVSKSARGNYEGRDDARSGKLNINRDIC
jgi:hypothetical protein